MKTVKQAAEYTVLERRDGRYAVRGKDKKWINGEAKVEILVKGARTPVWSGPGQRVSGQSHHNPRLVTTISRMFSGAPTLAKSVNLYTPVP